jgi:chromosome segregation ATPase
VHVVIVLAQLVKERSLQKSAHQQLLLDQVTLQSLHEQLTTEYENLLREKEGLKATQRDLRNEVRTLKELCSRQETSQTLLEQEKEKLKTESRSLGNLRAEHSSLKVRYANDVKLDSLGRSICGTGLELCTCTTISKSDYFFVFLGCSSLYPQ